MENERICYICGCVVEDDDDRAVCVDGDLYCGACRDDELTVCDNCDELHRAESVSVVHDGYGRDVYWCERCVDRLAYRCADCDELYSYGLHAVRGRDDVCTDCTDNYYYCEDCDYYIDPDDWNRGGYVLPNGLRQQTQRTLDRKCGKIYNFS